MDTIVTDKGFPLPYGVSIYGDWVNFSIVSKDHISLTLSLFDPLTPHVVAEIPLDEKLNRTGDVWHIALQGISPDLRYAYKVESKEGQSSHYLLDPYAKEVASGDGWPHPDDYFGAEHIPYFPLGRIIDKEPFDWEGDRSPGIPMKDLVIYEMHVRGFTHNRTSGAEHPGSYLGVIEKIRHLVDLGVNAVELMPVHEFNEREYVNRDPLTKQRLCNYWGYSTVNFFSPMSRYATKTDRGSVIREFKEMVKELHRNGIEVILDVVYNHTAEGNAFGPVYSFKGLANSSYYLLDKHGHYLNFSGCGNTFNCNNPLSLQLIIDSLRYWATEMHVDGFRFDLASIFMRGQSGMPKAISALVNAISEDPLLSQCKLIAEPWDAAGLYQVGGFCPNDPRWAEWNGKYRDSSRRFIKGVSWQKGEFASRLCGSQDLYGNGRTPSSSINFVTSHDGFTLKDLVSYNQKHNFSNGEDNRDGSNENDSWNCGEEGQTDKQEVISLRERQMRNFHLALMVSQGVPMVLMKDEYGHTKLGNNNSWCQDNDLNWFLWDQLEANADFYRFYRKMIKFRKEHPVLHQGRFLDTEDIAWHGVVPLQANWNKDDRIIAFTLYDNANGEDLYVAFNASAVAVSFTLPAPKRKWHLIVDTNAAPPNDFFDNPEPYENDVIELGSFSAVLLKDVCEEGR